MARKIVAPAQGGHAYSLERDLSKAAGLPGPRKSTSRSVEYSDTAVDGLRLTLGRRGGAGTGSWSWRYVVVVDGKREYRRLPLGRYPGTEYDDAVEALQQAKCDKQGGSDPHKAQEARAKEKAGRITFSDLVDGKATEYFSKKKRSREPLRILRKHAVPVIGDIAIEDLTVAHIEQLIEGVLEEQRAANKKGTVANALRAVLSTTLKLVKKRTLVRDIQLAEALPHGSPKEIFIDQPDQARRMISGCYEHLPEPFGDMITLQLLTGARPVEISSLRVSNVLHDFTYTRQINGRSVITTVPALRWPTTKNGRSHTIPLSRQAYEIVKRRIAIHGDDVELSDPLFPSNRTGEPLKPTRTANRFQEIRPMLDVPAGFSPHCLRKSAATLLQVLGHGSHIPGLVLNHRPRDVTGRTYALYDHLHEISMALQLLADVVAPDASTDRAAIAPAEILEFPNGARA